jgi:hypothetical protein
MIPTHWPAGPTDLCRLSLSDKGNAAGTARHNYTPYYHELFSPIRKSVKHVFELGIFMGNSLRMWRDYFPSATVYGADIDAEYVAHARGERIVTAVCDERDCVAIGRIFHEWDMRFDIMIDDGLHTHKDCLLFFSIARLWLRLGGLYIIEDLSNTELKKFRQLAETTKDGGWETWIQDGHNRVVNGEAVPDNNLLVMRSPVSRAWEDT